MAGIGIDFVLRANTAIFTKGLATANNKLLDLKKGLKGFDFGRRFSGLVGVGAIVASLTAVINSAHETRKSLEEMGLPVPDTIRAVDRIADALGDAKKSAIAAGVEVVGFFAKIGSQLGENANLIRQRFGANLIDANLGEKISEAADKSVGESQASMKSIMAQQSTDSLRAAEKNLADIRRKNAQAQMNDMEKLNALIEERGKIEAKLAAIDPNTKNRKLIIDTQAELEAKRGEVEAQRRSLETRNLSAATTLGKAQTGVFKAQADQKAAIADLFLPTIEGLAQSQKFGENDARSVAIEKARAALTLEEQARFAGGRGDVAAAIDLTTRANGLRAGLEGFAQSKDVRPFKDLEDSTNAAVEQLKLVREDFNKIFVVRK